MHPQSTDSSPLDVLRDRSPRPYQLRLDGGPAIPASEFPSVSQSRRSSAPDHEGSESGTEADDERPQLLALPPASIRANKGLLHGDGSASPLLTPNQLDSEGRRLSRLGPDQAWRARRLKEQDQAKLEADRRDFEKKRCAERIRRLSEAALLGIIGVAVIYGTRIWHTRWQWYLLEIVSQVAAIAGLVAFYPLRLVAVEHDAGHLHIWSRFHVPPSFDPATILYPTFIPTLVSLSLLGSAPHLFQPNLILGLASLPQRLFPDWARSSHVNVLHWTVAIVPVASSRLFAFLARRLPLYLSGLVQPVSAGSELTDLLLLFPLHQALLAPIHYLTTSSLLPAEKHLLSTALINVLLYAQSPQITILRSLLWVGGFSMLVACTHVLRWNVMLARLPSWSLKDLQRPRAQVPLWSQVQTELKNTLRNFLRLEKPRSHDDSEDEDTFVRPLHLRRLSKMDTFADSTHAKRTLDPISVAGDQFSSSIQARRDSKLAPVPKRRNTIASPSADSFSKAMLEKPQPRRTASRRRDWSRSLSPFQVSLRKRAYAAYVYIAVALIILLPVRSNVSRHALQSSEPILWALGYVFSGLPAPTAMSGYLTPANLTSSLSTIFSSATSVPTLRTALTAPNTRLLLAAYYALVLVLGLTAVLILSPTIEVDTRRKIFHAIMVCMLHPTIFIDPCFVSLALSLILAVFLLLEVLRAGQVPPLGTAISRFVAPYVDGRDLRGPMVVSHVFLLIGCAIPFWLSMASFSRDPAASGWELRDDARETAMLAGVVCVGMGDAAASLVGRRLGRRKWPWIGGKSLEGSAAFAAAVWVGLAAGKVWLRVGGWKDVNAVRGGSVTGEAGLFAIKALLVGCGASFMEAVLTGANDNVVVPVALWLLCRGLRV